MPEFCCKERHPERALKFGCGMGTDNDKVTERATGFGMHVRRSRDEIFWDCQLEAVSLCWAGDDPIRKVEM